MLKCGQLIYRSISASKAFYLFVGTTFEDQKITKIKV